jgi:hypothetical protein
LLERERDHSEAPLDGDVPLRRADDLAFHDVTVLQHDAIDSPRFHIRNKKHGEHRKMEHDIPMHFLFSLLFIEFSAPEAGSPCGETPRKRIVVCRSLSSTNFASQPARLEPV